MRVLASIALLCSILPAMAEAELLFSQNFTSGTSVSDYNANTVTGTVTGNDKFNYVDIGQSAIVSAAGNNWQVSNTGDGDTAWGKTLSATPLPLLRFQVDVTLAFAAGLTLGDPIGYFDFGSPANGASSWGNMAFTVGSAANTWGILGGSGEFTGTQTVTMFLNDSGSGAQYTNPLGNQQSVANGYNDVWIGNVFAGSINYPWIDDRNDITGFRYVSPNGWLVGQTTTTFDNFNVQSVPEPATLGMVSIAAAGLLLFRRRFSLMPRGLPRARGGADR
jgi:hypothetical protein